ncbi:glycosyltransferase [Flavobacterium sp. N2270]|uniref:glycosyltransferase n=1 Tax=Flavobacterium sp. N2270 TaxID=2986831 RepID=UPI0022240C37|nr:glycosyltransferase [Flavobacterium sp. N2270]
MKILHFIDEIKMGGAQTHLLTIVKEMVLQHPEDEQKIIVLFEDNSLSEKFREINVEVICLNLRSFFQTKSFFKILQLLKKIIKKEAPDVIETHLTWSRLLANTAGFMVGVKNRIGFEQGDIYMNSIKFRFLNFMSQFLFHKIIVCSNQLKQWTNSTHKIFNYKLNVMYNCVDLSKYKSIANKKLDTFIDNPPKFTFVTVGTLGRGVNKRVDVSIKAIGLLKEKGHDVGLLVCGDGDQRNELELLANKLNISNAIHFLGMRNDVDQLLPNAFAFIHAAPYEPFGIVCIEAMACGLPAIVPNSGGIQNIVSNGIDGFVYEKLSENALAEKMEKLILNDEAYPKFTENALENVKQYDVALYVSELYKLYHAK